MILKKGLPSKNELLICTVKSISPHSAFVSLDEYENLDAMLHISEVASGRIKNIKDYIHEGKQIVCLALRINRAKGYVDVSLKRVRESDKKRKLSEWRLSKRLDKFLSFIGKRINKSQEEVEEEILRNYDSLGLFMKVLQRKGAEVLQNLNIDKKWKDELIKEINNILEKKKIIIKKSFTIKSYEEEGVEDIKQVFSEVMEKNPDISVFYDSAPKYVASITTNKPKQGQNKINQFFDMLSSLCKKRKIIFGAAQ